MSASVLLRAAGTIESARAVAARERQPADRRDALHPGHSRHASHDLLIELELAILVGFRGRADAEDEEPIGIEAGGYFRQVREALDHQPGADQQDQRQADFGGDEERAPPAAAAGASAFALFQCFRRVPGRRRKRRDEPEQNAGDNRHAEAEGEDLAIEADLFEAPQAGRRHRHQERDRPRGEQRTERTADDREQHAFGEQLPDQTETARAHRGADGNFARAGRGAREQQVRHIRAADEKEEPDRREEKQQDRPKFADGVFVQRRDANAGIPVVVRILVLETPADRVHFGCAPSRA